MYHRMILISLLMLGKIVILKFKTRNGTPWWNANLGSWVIHDIVNGQNVVIKQTTLHLNQWSGYAKWWDRKVIALTSLQEE